MRASIEADRDAKHAAKAQKGNGKAYRSGPARDVVATDQEETIEEPKKLLEPFVDACATTTHFFTSWHPDSIEKALVDALRAGEIEPKVHAQKYKVKFEISTSVQQEQKEGEKHADQEVHFCVRILKLEQPEKDA